MSSLLNSKVIKASYRNKYFFDSNENSFKIKMEKIKQLMYSFKSKVDTTLHSYLHVP